MHVCMESLNELHAFRQLETVFARQERFLQGVCMTASRLTHL